MGFEDLVTVLDLFFENNDMKSFELEFEEPEEITEAGLQYLVGFPALTNRVKNNNEIIEEFTYYPDDDILIKLTFYYTKNMNNLYVRKIYGWREKRLVSEEEV